MGIHFISIINKILQLCHKENITSKLSTLKENKFHRKVWCMLFVKKQKKMLVDSKVNIKIYIRRLLDFLIKIY